MMVFVEGGFGFMPSLCASYFLGPLVSSSPSSRTQDMPDAKKTDTIRFLYTFQFPDGTEKIFEVFLDAHSLALVLGEDRPKPDWTKLKYYQCDNCPLKDDVEYCPVAVNLSTLIETFKDSI